MVRGMEADATQRPLTHMKRVSEGRLEFGVHVFGVDTGEVNIGV